MSDNRAELMQKLPGSGFRLMLLLAVTLLSLPSCGLLPRSHYHIIALPLSPEQGWVQLPTARWLVNPGIAPDALLFCPRETCGQQAFVARMELTGRETGFADLLMRDPARALASTSPTHKSRHKHPVSRNDVTPVSVAGWSGASVRLESRKSPGKVAHVAVVARRTSDRTYLMMAVAATSDDVAQQLRLALE